MTKYSTAFATTQDPLSESGTWLARVNANLTDMYVANGRAIAHALGVGAYDDSAALLSGFSTDFETTCSVYKDESLNRGATHENELLSRSTQTSTISTQYESLFSYTGGIQFIRWFNNGGTQDFAVITATLGSENLLREIVTGDRIRSRAAGSVFTLSVIDGSNVETLLGVYVNTVVTTGQPGIGGYTRSSDGGDATKFCYQDAQISDVFIRTVLATDDFNRANENPLSGSGNWTTGSNFAALRLVSNEVATATANTDSSEKYTGITFGVDHWSEITIGSSVGGGDFGAAVCCQSNGDCYLTTNYDATNIYIFSRIGVNYLQLGTITGVYVTGDRILLERFGDELRLYHNESLILTVTDDTTLLAGHAGIFGYDGTFRVTSWRGGNVVADYDAVPGSGGTVNTKDALDNTVITDANLLSLVRGRNNQDTTVIPDSLISSAIRGRDGQEVLTTADSTSQNMLRGVIATDSLIPFDELLAKLIWIIAANDGTVVTDELISAAGRIVTSILSSNFALSDEIFSQMERGVVATELVQLVDAALFQLSLQRGLDSLTAVSDQSFSFRNLTVSLQSAATVTDLLNYIFVSGAAGMFDGSKINVGYQRQPIILNGYTLEG